MRYAALAVDFDGTLAHDGQVNEATAAALLRLRASGRRLVLVTGRELPDLLTACPDVPLFDLVVAENGGLLYWPATGEQRPLAAPPPDALIIALEARGVAPISRGRVVVATWQPHEAAVLDAIQEVGLEHQLIFNKGAVMVLPPSVNKGSGLLAALGHLRLSPHNIVAIGDAENDHAMFAVAECAVAVANALPMVKERADLVTTGDHGAGVIEIADRMTTGDLEAVPPPARHRIALGAAPSGAAVLLPAYGGSILIAGSSGSGKSTILAGLAERLGERGYQGCLVDPEGDYDGLTHAVILGSWQHAPAIPEVIRVLDDPGESVVVNLLGVPLTERPAYVARLRAALHEYRGRLGRPHWIALDEAHHALPRWGEGPLPALFAQLGQIMLVTVDPEHLAPEALARIDVVVATGEAPAAIVRAFCAAVSEPSPDGLDGPLPPGVALVWRRGERRATHVVTLPPRFPHRRHRRKYAEGELTPERSFRFRGPTGEVDLRASSLQQFVAMTATVDDAVWCYHLRRGDFARWFRDVIRDDALAGEATRGEALLAGAIGESRAIIRRAIERRYTLPA